MDKSLTGQAGINANQNWDIGWSEEKGSSFRTGNDIERREENPLMTGMLFMVMMGVVGLIAQFVDGALGMGYGVFSTSLLVGMGFLPAIASASVHTAEVFTTFISGVSHWRLGNIKRGLVLPMIVPGVIGAVGGAWLLTAVSGKVIKPYVAAILLVMGAIVLVRFIRKKKITPNGEATSVWKLALLALAAAFMDALGGGGWGPIATPSLILSENHEPRKVVGSVNLVEFFVTIAAVITFLVRIGPEDFEWGVVVALLIGGAVAAPVAAWACRKLPARALGILIGAMLVVLNARTLIVSLF